MIHSVPELKAPQHPLGRLPEEWEQKVREWGMPAYRGRQVFEWIHKQAVWEPEQMHNLPKALREHLAEEGLEMPLELAHSHRSADSTRKLLVEVAPGQRVETVLIPQLRQADPDVDDEDRRQDEFDGMVPGQVVTQCISSQVGCAMACVFCASGRAGFKRNLSAAQIAGQVLFGKRHLEEKEFTRNVVFMGMGEPLHNYDAVARALVLLSHPRGLGLSRRRVTLSTSGLVPQIDRLAADFDGQVQLAISLHAVDDARRSEIMPINRKHPLPELMACLRRYPLPKRRRITIEYTLIRGVNDGMAEADQLARLLKGIPAKVNLIPMNPIEESSLRAPDHSHVTKFQERLRSHRLGAYVRRQRGDDIAAACGQLALHGEKRRVKVRPPIVKG